MSNKHIDSIQFETLKIEVESLDEVSVLLNLLYTRTNLGLVEDCEIELALRGIGTLLNNQINDIKKCIAFMLGEEFKND